jgi:hypothetical protein
MTTSTSGNSPVRECLPRFTSSLANSPMTLLCSALLISLNQIPYPLRIALPVPMAQNRISASGRINPNLRPEHSSRYLHRRDLRHRDTLLVAPKQAPLDAQHMLGIDYNQCRKKQVAASQAACREGLSLNWRTCHELGLHPLQGALFPDPKVANHQDAQEDEHLQQSKQPERLELHGPGK